MTTATAGGRLPGLDAPANICPAGVDPFSTCTWVRRDTWVKDFKTGQVIFEQKDVECPEHWSQEACNVLASKYFFGLPDTPQRETSVRDVLHRIARTITDWGTEGGHFDDAEGGLSAESFYNDLAYLMLHQYLAFNSPVWFNMGLHHVYGVAGGGGSKGYWYNPSTGMVETVDPMARPQASACFILKIEDSIKSIFDVAGESAATMGRPSTCAASASTKTRRA
jgi:ribonucleoside-diphosphate reductase alpha chain